MLSTGTPASMVSMLRLAMYLATVPPPPASTLPSSAICHTAPASSKRRHPSSTLETVATPTSARVTAVATFPPGSHPEIVYPVARVAASSHAGAAGFVDWLASPVAAEIFRRHGFTLR